jgi:hypothetical protein
MLPVLARMAVNSCEDELRLGQLVSMHAEHSRMGVVVSMHTPAHCQKQPGLQRPTR